MTGLRAGGIGSGLDINSLVSQLVAAERSPQSQRINRMETGAKFRLSAVATLSNAFDGLKRALDTLRSDAPYGARTVVSSAEDRFTATAGAQVPAGSYGIEVLALASAPKLISAPIDGAAILGEGTLRISVGDTSFDVQVSASDTINDLRGAINSAAQAAGAKVGATVIRGDDGQLTLSLTGQQTGAANVIGIAQTGGTGDLSAFTFDPDGGPSGLTALSAASDAQVRIDGVLRSSASNQVSDAISGLTLTLRKVSDPDAAPATLTISADNTPARNAVQGLVTAYNAAVGALAAATRFNPATGEAGALNGDALARGATGDLRNAMAAFIGGAADLGLSSRVDGSIVFDVAKFNAALGADPARVEQAVRGLGESMGQVVSRYVGNDGGFSVRTKSLNDQIARATSQREALDRRMEAVEARYLRQFTALDSLVATLTSTGNFLTQQLAGLRGLNEQR